MTKVSAEVAWTLAITKLGTSRKGYFIFPFARCHYRCHVDSINRLTSLLSIATVSKTLNMAACENSGSQGFLFTSVLLFTSVIYCLRFAFLFAFSFFCLRFLFFFICVFFFFLRFLFCLRLSLLGHRKMTLLWFNQKISQGQGLAEIYYGTE